MKIKISFGNVRIFEIKITMSSIERLNNFFLNTNRIARFSLFHYHSLKIFHKIHKTLQISSNLYQITCTWLKHSKYFTINKAKNKLEDSIQLIRIFIKFSGKLIKIFMYLLLFKLFFLYFTFFFILTKFFSISNWNTLRYCNKK